MISFTTNPDDDYGDRLDKFKWDISEKSLLTVMDNGHVYKVRRANIDRSIQRLVYTRYEIDRLCSAIYKYMKKNNLPTDIQNKLNLFLSVHGSGNYLLNEIPEGTEFEGINKPRGRHTLKSYVNIGPDKNSRASYRSVFLKLYNDPIRYKNLVLHELAHTAANHIRWRPDDHGQDFKECEGLLTYLGNTIGFLSNYN